VLFAGSGASSNCISAGAGGGIGNGAGLHGARG
jgi:hypothetical protein